MENRARALGLYITALAINRAVKASGWEAQGDREMAIAAAKESSVKNMKTMNVERKL